MDEGGSSVLPGPKYLYSRETFLVFKEHLPRSKTQEDFYMEWRNLSLEDKCMYERMGIERLNEMQSRIHKILEYMKHNPFPQFIKTSFKRSSKRASISSRPINQEAEMVKRSSKMVLSNKRLKMAETTKEECFLLSWRRWEDLDPNLLKRIFLLVPIHDLLFNVSSVCQSWQLACWDFLFWSRNLLDLSATDAGFGIINSSTLTELKYPIEIRIPGFFGEFESEDLYNKMAVNLMKLLWNIMEGDDVYGQCLQGWRLSIQIIIIPADLQIADTHLLFIAERSPCLNQLYLLGTHRLTVKGFSKAIQNWKHVKNIHLSLFNFDKYSPFIKEMGRNWQELEYLHIYLRYLKVDEDSALVIAKNLPRLKKLGFHGAILFPKGIVTLVEMCLELEEMCFDLCNLMVAKDASADVLEWQKCRPEIFVLSWTINGEGYVEWHIRVSDYEISNSLLSIFKSWIVHV